MLNANENYSYYILIARNIYSDLTIYVDRISYTANRSSKYTKQITPVFGC